MKVHGSRLFFLLVVLLTACSTSSQPTPTQSGTSSPSDKKEALALYFVSDTAQGFRLFREFHSVKVTTTAAEAAVKSLMTTTALDPDYSNLWFNKASLKNINVSGDTATLDLHFTNLNVGAEAEMRAIDQLVWTVTAAEKDVKKVKLLRDGESTETLAGHVDTRGLFTREPSYEVLAPVWITSVDEGSSAKRPLTFSGVAQTFEANVEWEVRQGAKVFARGATTAAEAAPARTPWKVTVPNLPVGTYTIRAFTSSAKDGSLVAEDTKRINLR